MYKKSPHIFNDNYFSEYIDDYLKNDLVYIYIALDILQNLGS